MIKITLSPDNHYAQTKIVVTRYKVTHTYYTRMCSPSMNRLYLWMNRQPNRIRKHINGKIIYRIEDTQHGT